MAARLETIHYEGQCLSLPFLVLQYILLTIALIPHVRTSVAWWLRPKLRVVATGATMADEAMILRGDDAVRSEIARRPGTNSPRISKASFEYTLPLANIPLAGRTYQPRYRLHPCESLLCLLTRRPTLWLAVLVLWSTLLIPSVLACKALRSGSGPNWNWKLDLELWTLEPGGVR